VPVALTYLWEWWCELSLVRRAGMSGPEPIDYRDVEAWARLMDKKPEPYEVRALLQLDRVLLNPGDE
jgi:hypothetical protein